MKIAIRTDGDLKLGLSTGHLKTSKLIADTLIGKGNVPSIFVKPSPIIHKFFTKGEYNLITLKGDINEKILKGFDKLIVDLPDDTKYDFPGIKTYYVDYKDYTKRIIHPLFERYRHIPKPLYGKNVLVSLGGHDPFNATYDIVKYLTNLDSTVFVVVGAAFGKRDGLIKKLGGLSNVTVFDNPENLAKLMFESHMGIVAGGNTMYEAMCIGLPSLVVSFVEHQIQNCKIPAQKKAIMSYGMWDKNNLEKIKLLLANYSYRKVLSENGKKMIDGLGLDRFLREVLNEE